MTLTLTGMAGFSAVAVGAFGAHGLRDRLVGHLLEVYRTGVLYHLVHAVALLAVAALGRQMRWPRLVAGCFAGGIVIFSGSLYLLALTGVGMWGAVTPVGGVLFLIGWATLLVPPIRA